MGAIEATADHIRGGGAPASPDWRYHQDVGRFVDPAMSAYEAVLGGQTGARRSVPGAPTDYTHWAGAPQGTPTVSSLMHPFGEALRARDAFRELPAEAQAELWDKMRVPPGQQAWGAVTGAFADSRQRQEDRQADRQFERDWNERIRGDDIPLDLNWKEKRDLRREARQARRDESRQAFEERRDAGRHERDVRRWDENQNRRDPSRMHPDDVDWFVSAMSRPADPSAAQPPAETPQADPQTATEEAAQDANYIERADGTGRMTLQQQQPGTGWVQWGDDESTRQHIQAPERSPYALPVEAERALAALNSVRRTADSMRDRAQQNYVPGSPSYQRIMDAADRYEQTYGANHVERFQHATHMAQNPAQGQNLSVSDQLAMMRWQRDQEDRMGSIPPIVMDRVKQEAATHGQGRPMPVTELAQFYQMYGGSWSSFREFVDAVEYAADLPDDEVDEAAAVLRRFKPGVDMLADSSTRFSRGGLVQKFASGGFVNRNPTHATLISTALHLAQQRAKARAAAAAADTTRMDPRGASHANSFGNRANNSGNHVPTGPQNSGLVVTGGDPDVLPHMQGRVPTEAEFHNWRHSDQNTTWDFLSEERRTNRVPSSAVGSAYDRSVARDPNAQLIRPLASEPKPERSSSSSSFRMGPRPSSSTQGSN